MATIAAAMFSRVRGATLLGQSVKRLGFTYTSSPSLASAAVRLLHVAPAHPSDSKREEDSPAPPAVNGQLRALGQGLGALLPLGLLPTSVALAEAASGAAAAGTVTTAAGYTLPVMALTFLQTAGPMCFLFLQASGAQPALKILREKTTGQLSLLPFISLFTNCVIWTWYGYLLQDSTIMLPNASGLVVGLIYTSIFLRHASSSQTPMLLGSAAICGAVTAGALMMPAAQVAPYIGYLGDVVAVVLMASPLAVVRTVLKEKSTRSMPFGTSVATFFNAVCWSGYGILVMNDPLIYVPNLLGMLAATVQLSLFARFGIGK